MNPLARLISFKFKVSKTNQLILTTTTIMILLNYILQNCDGWCRFIKSQSKYNHLMDRDDVKIFVNNKKKIQTFIQTLSSDLTVEWN